MRKYLFIVLTAVAAILVTSFAQAGTIEIYPAPPADAGIPAIPATAGRNVQCVGIDDNGVAYCNVIYSWKVSRNRFCCTYQREHTAIVAPDGSMTWLTPLDLSADPRYATVANRGTRISSVSNDGRHIAGLSMGDGIRFQSNTLWHNGVPTHAAGIVSIVSNNAYTLNGVAFTYEGVQISPASCQTVVALNDVGGGLCFKDLVPGSDDFGVRGIARFDDPEDDDGGRFFIVPVPSAAYVKASAINNVGAAIVTVGWNYSAPSAYLSYVTGQVSYLPDFYGSDINDSGTYTGRSVAPGVLANAITNAINGAGWLAGTLGRNGYSIGFISSP